MSIVELKGGLLVDDESVRLAIALETSGIMLTARDGVLLAAPRSALTEKDMQAIKQHRMSLLAIAAYEPPRDEPGASRAEAGTVAAPVTEASDADRSAHVL